MVVVYVVQVVKMDASIDVHGHSSSYTRARNFCELLAANRMAIRSVKIGYYRTIHRTGTLGR